MIEENSKEEEGCPEEDQRSPSKELMKKAVDLSLI
jgi:hypothetical protein